MIEITTRKISVELKYVPHSWCDKIIFDEAERVVAFAITNGATEVALADLFTSVTHWFAMKTVPLDTKLEGHKAFLSVEISEQMVATRSLVSLEQVAI
jgi:hypothetical protein